MIISDTLNFIEKTAQKVYKEFGTIDPFRICREKGIIVQYAPLGGLNAYYTVQYRIPVITINSLLDEYSALIACDHELGHLFLGHNENKLYFSQRTRIKVTPWEIAANTFVVYHRLQQLDPDDLYYLTKQQLAKKAGIPDDLLSLLK